jgi:hypothetical protein
MRSLATGTIVLLLLSLFGSHPCSCEIREKLAAASEPADSHSCCHSAEPEQEQQERHACIGCESCGAETGTPPGCGGKVTTDVVADRDERNTEYLLQAICRIPETRSAPASIRGDDLVVVPKSRSTAQSTVMLC